MATYTENYHFSKPGVNDPIDITILNNNFDAIDTKLKEIEDDHSGDEKQDAIAIGYIMLTSEDWTGTGPFTQAIEIVGSTEYSKIDLQPDAETLAQLVRDKVTALWVVNDNGSFVAYSLGATPTTALSIQYTRTEIAPTTTATV